MAEKESELRNHGEGRSPEEIRREIDQTRERLDSTVSALEEKLSPSQLIDKAWDWLQNSENSKSIVGFARRHPLLLAVMGIGVGWLALESARARRRAEVREDWREEEKEARAVEDAEDWSTEETAKQRRGRLRLVRAKAAAGVRATGRKVRDTVDVHPLAAATVAFGLGLAGGLSLRPSRVENRLLGRTSDRVVEQTKEAGLEAARRARNEAKRAARRTTEAAKSAIREATDRML